MLVLRDFQGHPQSEASEIYMPQSTHVFCSMPSSLSRFSLLIFPAIVSKSSLHVEPATCPCPSSKSDR
jgi:hypothetical protein